MIKPSLRDWRAGGVPTLKDLPSTIKDRAKAWSETEGVRELIQKLTCDWMPGVQDRLQVEVAKIAAQHNVPSGAMRLDSPVGLNFRPIHINTGGGELGLESVTDAVAAVVSLLVGAIAGKIVFLFVFDPMGFGWIVAAVLGLLALYGPFREYGKAKLQEKKIPVTVRKLVLKDAKLNELCDKERPTITSVIREELKKDTSLTDKLIESVRFQFKTIVTEAARDATLRIS